MKIFNKIKNGIKRRVVNQKVKDLKRRFCILSSSKSNAFRFHEELLRAVAKTDGFYDWERDVYDSNEFDNLEILKDRVSKFLDVDIELYNAFETEPLFADEYGVELKSNELCDYFKKDIENFDIDFPFEHSCPLLIKSEYTSSLFSRDGNGVNFRDLLMILKLQRRRWEAGFIRHVWNNVKYKEEDIGKEISYGLRDFYAANDYGTYRNNDIHDRKINEQMQKEHIKDMKRDMINLLNGELIYGCWIIDWDFDGEKIVEITVKYEHRWHFRTERRYK